MTQVFRDLKNWQTEVKSLNYFGKKVGFVPTMGALHDGHKTLMARSKNENDITVVSIYVNPTQFNNPEDFNKYPITWEQDLKILEDLGVDYCLAPTYDQIYADGYRYQVTENDFSAKLCGAHRPGHFTGVLTVVLKLLNLVSPTRAYFGEKDYQQLTLIREMVSAFFLQVEIVECQTVRASDGLALSSRNLRLSQEQRRLSVEFPKVLKSDLPDDEVIHKLSELGFRVDYVESIKGRRFGAVHIGDVRLIDNVTL